jgi:hypothetical protein
MIQVLLFIQVLIRYNILDEEDSNNMSTLKEIIFELNKEENVIY